MGRGQNQLGKTTVIQAGTTIQRTAENGFVYSRTLEHDVVLPVESMMDGETFILGCEAWYITEEAWGWTEADW